MDSEDKNKKRPEEVSWTASEFIAHHKSVGWYLALLMAVLGVASLAYVLTRDIISAVTIIIVGVLFALLASKKPRQISYKVDHEGITIGPKLYPYEVFKSFAVIQDGAIECVNLFPLKKLMPEISIYFPPDQGDKILDVLGSNLPHDQKGEHSFDRLMKKIRF